MAGALFFTGCGKKCEKKNKKDENTTKIETAGQSGVPVYKSEDEKFFDFDEGEVKDFAFVADEEEGKGKTVAKKDGENDGDWEDEDLTMAWENEGPNKDGFKVVNFDLNKNSIRPDQKPVVEENVKVAETAAKDGKNILVKGFCCPLGSPSFNLSLSEQRAKTIRDEMVKNGIAEEKVTVLGCGSEHTIVTSKATDRQTLIKQLAPNRRSEISLN